MKWPWSRKDPIQRDENNKPIICDCPDGAEHPCTGTGWCRIERTES